MTTLRLVETCGSCPQQYDVYQGDKLVAYFRLRHGSFSIDVPDRGGETIFIGYPEGDRLFRNEEERQSFLTMACGVVENILKLKID